MRPNAESVTRSVTKSLSWRVIASLTTFLLVFLLTGKIEAALSISALEIILKMLLYFFHERLWQRIGFGRKNTTPAVIWFTGLSGSGKSTIGKQVAEALRKQGHQVEWLDGDLTREFFPQTGFSKEERDAHVLRSGFLARTLEKNGVFVVASYISPYRDTREQVRRMCQRFIEIHVSTPLEECERRDVKGLYAKARRGQIKQFTGIDDPYEAPDRAEITVNTLTESTEQAVRRILISLES